MTDTKKLQNKLKNHHLISLVLLALLTSVSFISLLFLSHQQEKDAITINIAASQGMLSQRIAYLSLLHHQNVTNNKIDSTLNSELTDVIKQFSINQNTLTDLVINQSNTMPRVVNDIYFNKPLELNNTVSTFVKRAKELSLSRDKKRIHYLLSENFTPIYINELLDSLDLVVIKVTEYSNKRRNFIETLEGFLWFCSMALLIATSLLIFRPLERIIQRNKFELLIAKKQSEELKLAINNHAIVYRINMDEIGSLTEVNQRFLDFYCYSEEEIIGRSVFDICGGHYSKQSFKDIFQECITNKYWHGESINKIKGGRELWLSTTIVPLMNDDNRFESFIVIQNDISGIKQTEVTLNQLHKITSNIEESLHDKIQDILALGKEIFNLPIALISEINEEEYEVVHCHAPETDIKPGDKFDLSNTYCIHTLNADKPLSFHQAGSSQIKNHPCYLNFGLESYIGVPLTVDGKRFGTLNFSGPEVSPRPFSKRELDLIQLFSHWISAELTRVKHQDELFGQQLLMEQMAQQARIGAWEVDLITNKVYWSSMTKEIHEVAKDYQPDLAGGINFYKEGESREAITRLVTDSIENGTDFEQDLQLVTAKGNNIWVAARGRSEFMDGKCTRLYGSFQDITDKMLSQHQVTQHNQRMSLAADSAGIGVWELDLTTNELKWDDWMFKLYGVPSDQFLGTYETWENGLHPEDKEKASELLHNAISSKSRFDAQFRIIWPTGEIKHIKAAASISYDSAGHPISMTGVNYDITDSVENEIALTKAKEQAEIAAIAKNEFFASMSHEIRTPMNGVIGMLDLVKDSKLNNEQKHRVGIAQQSAKSLLSLINDILDFSKIDANKLELENVTFNLRDMIGDLAESFAQQAQSKGLELIVDLVDVEESMVSGDSNRIRQILTNLLANAIKFTKKGEVSICISQTPFTPGQWKIVAAVSDTGIGISTSKQQGLFDVFTQVDASTTREYGGTGLGLAIVKKLCLCMQGNVKAESREGKGSTFTCDFILNESSQSLKATPESILKGKRVLILENNQLCAESIKRQLTRWNLGAEIFNSAQAVLAVLNKQTSMPEYDLLMVNRELPQLDLTLFINQIHNNPMYQSIKITFMTLMSSEHNDTDAREFKIDAFLPKPVITRDYHRALNTLLVKQSTQDSRKLRDTQETTDEKQPPNVENCWTNNVKLLLVEDNRVNQMVAMGVLKKIGITEVIIAVNGKDALDKLRLSEGGSPFSFIYMDCQMPEMDGYEATKLIREGEAGELYRDIPIVAMTANAMVGDEEKCLSAGMNDYLVKPINKDLVEDTLKIFLENKYG